jgi:long-chain acyl-CoA synthetase
LVSVPQMFYKINDRISAKLADAGRLKQLLFSVAMRIARQRREALNSRGSLSPGLALRWALATKIFANIKDSFGGNLKYAITGGGALALDIQHFFADIGIPVIEGYGLTETSPIVACENYGLTEHLQGGLRPLPGVKVVLYEPGSTRQITNPTEEGEICVIGRLVMLGYHDNETATKEVIMVTPEGERCFRTGDLGRLSADGVLTITGRCKEQYKLTNGKYVMPSKLEQFALRSRYVEQVYVHGANQPYNIALVYPDLADLKKDFPDRFTSDSVADAIAQHGDFITTLLLGDFERIFKAEIHTAGYEMIKRVHLLSEPFSVANNMLTQKLSMKRRVISEAYHDAIKALYSHEASNSV